MNRLGQALDGLRVEAGRRGDPLERERLDRGGIAIEVLRVGLDVARSIQPRSIRIRATP